MIYSFINDNTISIFPHWDVKRSIVGPAIIQVYLDNNIILIYNIIPLLINCTRFMRNIELLYEYVDISIL